MARQPAVVLAAAAVLCALLVGGQARVLSEIAFDNSVDAGFKNVFARGSENNVDQEVAVSVPDASAAEAPAAVADLLPTDFIPVVLDPNNPSCTLADKEVYQTFSVTDDKPIGKEAKRGKVYEFYVKPGLEVRPIAIAALDDGEKKGDAKLIGDGIFDEVEMKVDKDVRIKTTCGTWAWNANGQYKMEVETDDAEVILRFYVRKRGQKLGAFNANSALNLGLDVETTVAGSNKQLETNTDVTAESKDGKLVLTMSNKVGDKEEDPFANFNWDSIFG